MTVDTQDLEPRLIRWAAGLDLDLRPLQGLWTEEQYLKLTDQINQLLEFTDGYIASLAMPTCSHQRMFALLYQLLLVPDKHDRATRIALARGRPGGGNRERRQPRA